MTDQHTPEDIGKKKKLHMPYIPQQKYPHNSQNIQKVKLQNSLSNEQPPPQTFKTLKTESSTCPTTNRGIQNTMPRLYIFIATKLIFYFWQH